MHNDDVTAIAFHPDGKYVATGGLQPKGEKPYIHIWDSTTMKEVASINKPL